MNNDALNLIALANELKNFIRSTIPECKRINKYGGVLFTIKPEEKEGQFCGVFIYQQHVQISFSLGALINDPENVLKGSGKFRRHINFSLNSDIDFKCLKRLLTLSLKL